MQIQRMGILYKLYCIGWRNASLKDLSPFQHLLFSIFLYYRRGFAEGSKWSKYSDLNNQEGKNQI